MSCNELHRRPKELHPQELRSHGIQRIFNGAAKELQFPPVFQRFDVVFHSFRAHGAANELQITPFHIKILYFYIYIYISPFIIT